jgi:glycosyltransferase involved in cell wall biosynthesis
LTAPRRLVFFLESYPFPSGGVEVVYRQVEMLNAAGIAAVVALPAAPDRRFFSHRAPELFHGGAIAPGERDVLIFPEGFVTYLEALRAASNPKYVYCQNQFYVLAALGSHADYQALGVRRVIASSRSVADFFSAILHQPDLAIIPPAIDLERFRPAPKRRVIAAMPRKLPDIARLVREGFRRRHPRHAAIEWDEIDGADTAETARRLGQARWFVGFGHYESLGLPPLEAMAAEAVVVGFDGEGGREYATLDNGFWCPAGDWLGCIDRLAAAIDLVDHDPARHGAMLAAGRATAERYAPAAMRRALLAFWERELAGLA